MLRGTADDKQCSNQKDMTIAKYLPEVSANFK